VTDVSVVVATTGTTPVLDLCAAALARNTLRPRELVLVDGSPDGAGARLEAALSGSGVELNHLVVPRCGVSRARNRGIAAARCDLLAFTDDDCVPADEWLAALVTALEERRAGDLPRQLDPHRDGARRDEAVAAELAAVLRVAEAQQRVAGLREHDGEEPAPSEQPERRPERRMEAEAEDDRHQRPELDGAERQRRPRRLVRQQPVPHLEVERDADGGHQRDELHGPPAVQGARQGARREQHRQQRGDEHGGEIEIPRDLDIGHAHRRQRVIAHRLVHQRTELAAQFGGDAVGALEGVRRHVSREP